MEKSKKDILIISGVVVLLVLMIVGVIIFTKKEANKEEKNNGPKTQEMVKIDEVLGKVKELNKSFSKESLDSEVTKESPGGNVCYKYIGENSSEVIQKFVPLYNNLLTMDYGFILERPDEESEYDLYVCKPNNCELSEDYDYDVISSEESEISFKLKNNEDITYKYVERDNNWKLDQPIFSCKK